MKRSTLLPALLLLFSFTACHTSHHATTSDDQQQNTTDESPMKPLFNGNDLSGWERVGGDAGGWYVEDGVLHTEGGGEKWEKGEGGGWLSTTETYDDFKLTLEFKVSRAGNSGVFLRAPREGDPAFQGLEVQILDDYAEKYEGLKPSQYTGSIYEVAAPVEQVSKKAGEWQKFTIVCQGPEVKVSLNGTQIIAINLNNHTDKADKHPGIKRREGYIGLQNHNTEIAFRNIRILEL